jgi:hypothetical protein
MSNSIQEVTNQLSEYLPDGVTTFAKNIKMAITRINGNWNEEAEIRHKHTDKYVNWRHHGEVLVWCWHTTIFSRNIFATTYSTDNQRTLYSLLWQSQISKIGLHAHNVQCVHKAHSGFWKIVYYVALCVSLNVGVTIHAKLGMWIL